MLYRHIRLCIVIKISKDSCDKCVKQSETVYSSIYILFFSCIQVVLFSSLSKEIYLHGLYDVKFYIATCQRKT